MVFIVKVNFRTTGSDHVEFGRIVGFRPEPQAFRSIRHVQDEIGVLVELVGLPISRSDDSLEHITFGALVEMLAFLERAGLVLDIRSQPDFDSEVQRIGGFALVSNPARHVESVALWGECDFEVDFAGCGAADGDGFLGIESRGMSGSERFGIDFPAGGLSIRFGLEDFDFEDDGIALADDLAAFRQGMKGRRCVRHDAELKFALFHDHEVTTPWFLIDRGEFGMGGAEWNDDSHRQSQVFHEGVHGSGYE